MKSKNFQTHVIAGTYKGLKLDLPPLATTRSSKSILKESLFNTIAQDVIDENFVEVFAGSGSVMIEAVSRGAKHGYGVEKSPDAYKILLQNCKKINKDSFTCRRGDSFSLVPELVNSLLEPTYLYMDPPFEYREDMENIYDKCFEMLLKIKKQNIIMAIFEHMSILKMPERIGEFTLKKTKKFGKSSLSYYE